MLKFIIPAIFVFLLVLFWEKINEAIYKNFKIRINYIAILIFLAAVGSIIILLYN
tara:strand:- start:300 stop:464 length:165 start_codon:yes stop_codon:yes gene_type:complete